MRKPKDDLKSPLNTVGITTTNLQLLHLIQLHDSAFPIGGYTHTFGMETFIQKQNLRTAEDLYDYCAAYLIHNLACGDGIFIKEAYKWFGRFNWEELYKLEELCHASKLAAESRESSKRIGRQFLKTVLPLSDCKVLTRFAELQQSGQVHAHHAIVYGLYAAYREYPLEAAISTFLYSSVSNLVQNAVRAIPLGQSAGVHTLYRLLAVIEETAKLAENNTLDDLSNQAIEIELASMQHEFLFSRLFIS